jgi:hypothetical protein
MTSNVVHRFPDRGVAALAARQHGVVARWQLRDVGMSDGQIAGRLERGRLHPVHRGVYAVGHRLLTREGRWMAAVLSLGPSAVLSHRSAAALWGLVADDGPRPDVTVPGRGTLRRRGVLVHRTPAVQRTRHRGIPVTTPMRTLVDLAAVAPRRVLVRAVEHAERLRVFDLRELERLMGRRPGAAALRAAVAAWDGAPVRSELERRFLELCDRHGLPRPLVNTLVAGLEVDFAWREPRLVVETDGLAHHGTRASAERDRRRDAVLAIAGWRVQRFTWRQVTDEPAAVAAVVRRLLGDAAPEPPR